MKSFFETLVLAAGFVFISWVIIAAGVQVKVTWRGEEYSFKVGGIDGKELQRDIFLSSYNCSDDELELLIPKSLLRGASIEDYCYTLYPQYTQGTPPVEHEYVCGESYYTMVISGRLNMKMRQAIAYFNAPAFQDSSLIYSVSFNMHAEKNGYD